MKCQVLIDWLTFTVKSEKDPDAVIIEYLDMDPELCLMVFIAQSAENECARHQGLIGVAVVGPLSNRNRL